MHPQILRLIEEQEEEKGELSFAKFDQFLGYPAGFPLSVGLISPILSCGDLYHCSGWSHVVNIHVFYQVE